MPLLFAHTTLVVLQPCRVVPGFRLVFKVIDPLLISICLFDRVPGDGQYAAPESSEYPPEKIAEAARYYVGNHYQPVP